MLTEVYNGFAAIPRMIGLGWSDAAFIVGVMLFCAVVLIPVIVVYLKLKEEEDEE